MHIRTLSLVVVAALAALLLAGRASSRPNAVPTLVGTTGPSFTITLKRAGKAVKTLKPGTYRIVVNDKASIHNFVLEKSKGGTFERSITSVGFVGTKTLTVKLTKGSWEFYCRPHEQAGMKGEFTVK
jgi:type IV pilus biogenesis protein CpaD/CtpE